MEHKLKECCICLEDFPRHMSIPCTTCKYSSCKDCFDKMTIIDTTDRLYPEWGDHCHWNPTYIITCPMCRQPMIGKFLHRIVQSKLVHYGYQYMTRSTLDWELDDAQMNYPDCPCNRDCDCCRDHDCYCDDYSDKVFMETENEWNLGQTPLMRRWVNNHLSDPDIVDNYLKNWYGESLCTTESAALIKDYWSMKKCREKINVGK